MIVGLQGSGKTTTTGKLARWLSKNGHNPDHGFGGRLSPGRAAATERDRPRYQAADLRRLGEETKPLELSRAALREARQTGRDVVLIDTAGRLHIDDQI